MEDDLVIAAYVRDKSVIQKMPVAPVECQDRADFMEQWRELGEEMYTFYEKGGSYAN